MRHLSALGLSLVLLLPTAFLNAQEPEQQPQVTFEATELAPGLHMIEGVGGFGGGCIAAQEKILELAGPNTRIIPGHGPVADREDLAASVAMLKEMRPRVRALIDQGEKSVEEAREADPVEGFEEWDWQLITSERMVRQMYHGLAGNA